MTADFTRLHIFGAGGFGREVAWLARECFGSSVVQTFVVDSPAHLRPPIHGIEVHLLSDVVVGEDSRYVIAVGDPNDRQTLAGKITSSQLLPTTLIHDTVRRSEFVTIGAGSIICANAVLTCDIAIGCHVHVNLACTIGHDVAIGDFSTLSPGVNVSGNVEIGERVFVGSNVSFINGRAGKPLVIGDDAIIAAGACVTQDVAPGAMVAGVPAIRKR